METRCPQAPPADSPFKTADTFEWHTHWEPGAMIPASSVNGVVETWQTGWLKDWGEPPLCCSYCGGIRPADALKLLNDGWEVESTGKPYKRYLNPPGTAKARAKVVEMLEANRLEEAPDYNTPVPPVKLYVYHLSAEEINRFNHMLKTRRT